MPSTATRRAPALAAVPAAPDHGWGELVNQLTQQLAAMQRTLSGAQQKAVSATRSLETRTQELVEARAAVSLLLATLDSTSDGLLSIGYFGRAMHYNSRFTEMWRIGADKLPTLNEGALLAMQLAQVRDPEHFLALVEARKEQKDAEHFDRVELADGRLFECHTTPQRVKGKRVGTVTRWRDITDSEKLAKLVARLESEVPQQVAAARVD